MSASSWRAGAWSGHAAAELRPALVSVVRRPHGLFALVSEPVLAGLCRNREEPLAAVPATVCPQRDRLLDLWAQLDDRKAGVLAARELVHATTIAADVPRMGPHVLHAATAAMAGARRADWRLAACHPGVVAWWTGSRPHRLRRFAEQAAGRLADGADLRRLAGAWYALDLEREPTLRDQVVGILVRRPPAVALDWIGLLVGLDPAIRESVLMAVLDQDVATRPPFSAHAWPACGVGGVPFVVSAIRKGLGAEEIGAAVRAGVHRLHGYFRNRMKPAAVRPAGWWQPLEERSRRAGLPPSATIWLRCLTSRAACDAASRKTWLDLDDPVGHALLSAAAGLEDDPGWRDRLDELFLALWQVSPMQRARFVDEFAALTDGWRRTPEQRRHLRAHAVRLARRACLASREPDTRTGRALASLVVAAGAVGEPGRAAEVPARALELLDAACATDGRAQRLFGGLELLAARQPRLVIDAAERWPRSLFKTARALGSLPRETAVPLLSRVDGSALPRRLRLCLEGRVHLTPGSIERHWRVARSREVPARLQQIAQRVERALARGLPLDMGRPAHRHAAQMIATPWEDMRALRKFVRSGCPPRVEHPWNARWLARHPRLDVDLWMKGLVRQVPVARHGVVRLAVERDPLEALRLGTLVGTCLSLGSTYADSAPAWAMDVNKQVVYARRLTDGHVVARQTLAVTEDDALAVGTVYPTTAPATVTWAFLEYDLAVSEALGLPLASSDRAVVAIVADDVMHDGVWDAVAPSGP